MLLLTFLQKLNLSPDPRSAQNLMDALQVYNAERDGARVNFDEMVTRRLDSDCLESMVLTSPLYIVSSSGIFRERLYARISTDDEKHSLSR